MNMLATVRDERKTGDHGSSERGEGRSICLQMGLKENVCEV